MAAPRYRFIIEVIQIRSKFSRFLDFALFISHFIIPNGSSAVITCPFLFFAVGALFVVDVIV